jgi:hypothetical protein
LQINASLQEKDNFANLSRVDVDVFSNVYVADFGTNHIDKFIPDGKFIMSGGSLSKVNGQLYFN